MWRKWTLTPILTPILQLPFFLLPIFTIAMLLSACAEVAGPLLLGPRAEKFLGPERKLTVSWGGLSPENALRTAIEKEFARRGITVAAPDFYAKFTVLSLKTENTREYFLRHPRQSADFFGETKQIVGDHESCYVKVGWGDARDIRGLSITYQWNVKDIDELTLAECMEFAFGR